MRGDIHRRYKNEHVSPVRVNAPPRRVVPAGTRQPSAPKEPHGATRTAREPRPRRTLCVRTPVERSVLPRGLAIRPCLRQSELWSCGACGPRDSPQLASCSVSLQLPPPPVASRPPPNVHPTALPASTVHTLGKGHISHAPARPRSHPHALLPASPTPAGAQGAQRRAAPPPRPLQGSWPRGVLARL